MWDAEKRRRSSYGSVVCVPYNWHGCPDGENAMKWIKPHRAADLIAGPFSIHSVPKPYGFARFHLFLFYVCICFFRGENRIKGGEKCEIAGKKCCTHI